MKLWIWIVIGIVLLGGIGLYFYFKKKATVMNQGSVMTPAPSPPKDCSLQVDAYNKEKRAFDICKAAALTLTPIIPLGGPVTAALLVKRCNDKHKDKLAGLKTVMDTCLAS